MLTVFGLSKIYKMIILCLFPLELDCVWWPEWKGISDNRCCVWIAHIWILAHIEAQQINLFDAHFLSVRVSVQSQGATVPRQWRIPAEMLDWESDSTALYNKIV